MLALILIGSHGGRTHRDGGAGGAAGQAEGLGGRGRRHRANLGSQRRARPLVGDGVEKLG